MQKTKNNLISSLYLYLLTMFLPMFLKGQVKPIVFPEEIHFMDTNVPRCYCKPGVVNKSRSKGAEISYGWLSSGNFQSEEAIGESLGSYDRFQNLELKLRAPLILKDHLRVILGYKFFTEIFDLDNFGTDYTNVFQGLDDRRLKDNSLSLIVSRSLDETQYLTFRLSYSSKGDYEQWMAFQDKYAVYKLIGAYGRKKSEDFEWGVGLSISKSFRRNNVLPFFVYNKTFNKKWGIESVLPAIITLRRNINERGILLAGINYKSRSYRLDMVDDFQVTPLAYNFNHSEIVTSLTFERQIVPWVWANVRVGYQYNFTSDFEAADDITPDFGGDPSNGIIFHFGIFISPPDKFELN